MKLLRRNMEKTELAVNDFNMYSAQMPTFKKF